uniref:(northern house mosquito) hypothetical protein n=1 Tax=Culex pipiens TaxID=7175 RepID=A0A8D8GC19_CULPI
MGISLQHVSRRTSLLFWNKLITCRRQLAGSRNSSIRCQLGHATSDSVSTRFNSRNIRVGPVIRSLPVCSSSDRVNAMASCFRAVSSVGRCRSAWWSGLTGGRLTWKASLAVYTVEPNSSSTDDPCEVTEGSSLNNCRILSKVSTAASRCFTSR